jgi:EAL domain-containing protein (putative c-di-GMP-specific phosphodiesterase class I)
LDDFGSGLSSFAYLKNLPVDFLKIGGGFVKGILENPMDLAMVNSISDIARVMGKQTIAEFVESDGILEKLREVGVDYAQGYAVGEPRPFEGLNGD